MREIKRKRFIYKRATFMSDPGGSITLEKLLRTAVKNLPKAVDRFEEVKLIALERRFVNYSGEHDGSDGGMAIYGAEFLAFEPGADQSTIAVDETATEISVEAIAAGKDHEFLAGAVYFGISGNHVILSQGKSLRASDLEEYLNWLIIEKAKLIKSMCRIRLEDHIPKQARSLVTGVKGINITAPIGLDQGSSTESVRPAAAPDPSTATASGSRFYSFKGPAWEALKGFLENAVPLPKGINVKDILDSPEIEVGLVMRWKSKPESDDNDFLDQIASNLRNVNDEFNYEIRSESGTISRDQIKIFDDQGIPWTKRGRPELSEIFPRMGVWLATLLEDGKVDP